MLDTETLLRNSNPKITGMFMLEKCVFVVEGETTGPGVNPRCDNVSFSGVIPTEGTPYASHAHSFYTNTLVSDAVLEILRVVKFEHPIAVTPHFYITYIELNTWFDSEADPTPSTMWSARSIFQLFKNLREWSFLVEEPFNSDHPMATYSKLVFDTLNPPQEILDEIDALPDMHLAKFLKGEPDYKLIPHPYPEVSEEFKEWVLQLSVDHAAKSFEEMLDEL
jgi:hypothetical protein